MSCGVAVLGASGAALTSREEQRSPAGERALSRYSRVVSRAREARLAATQSRALAVGLREAARKNAQESILTIWRTRQLRYDRLGPIVAMWAGDQSRPQPSELGGPGVTIDLRMKDSLHNLVSRLFSITVDISSAMTLNGDPEMRRRLQQILDKTDEVIKELRVAESRASSGGELERLTREQGRRIRPAEDRLATEVQPRELATSLLADAIHTIDRLARFARDNSQAAAMDLEEASHAAHRALVVLTPPHPECPRRE
jgi:hypothetical protein